MERTSKLFLADLGGSEQVKKSLVEVTDYKKLALNNAFFVFIMRHSCQTLNVLLLILLNVY